MVAFPNPQPHQIRERDHLGTIWEAARIAGVKPNTIRVWMTRGKIEPMQFGDSGPELFHLPTIADAAKVKPGRPKAA